MKELKGERELFLGVTLFLIEEVLFISLLGELPLHLIDQSHSHGFSRCKRGWEGELLEFCALTLGRVGSASGEEKGEGNDCWVCPT